MVNATERFGNSLRHWALLFGFTLLLAGCNSEPTAEVAGVVTLDGQPLSYGTVTFYPVAKGQVTYGMIQAGGAYKLVSSDDSRVSPGEYQVVVTAVQPLVGADRQALPVPGPQLAPAKYTQLSTTDLRFTVVAGENRIDLPLVSPSAP